MAASAEELAASVKEIASMMSRSGAATRTVQDKAVEADAAISQLSKTSKAMDGIVALITSIASKINLLAPNATIESARAGEAGRGFAVVAGEVKNLAQQAATATSQISAEIAELQAISESAVEALGAIRGSVDSLQQFIATAAAAVEQQAAVTQGMSSGMQSTANSVVVINENMTQITSAVGQVDRAVSETRTAAGVLVR